MRWINSKVMLYLMVSISIIIMLTANSVATDLKATVEGNTQFAVDLYSKLKDDQEGNLFLSPYSISTALAMTYGGARGNTAKEMADVLHFSSDIEGLFSNLGELETRFEDIQKKGEVKLSIVNSLWPQVGYPFLEEYLSLIRVHFGVTITPVDYMNATEESRLKINQWVENKTEDKIKELIRKGDLSVLTRLVLVNAIYFKGNWANQFKVERTQPKDFRLLDGGVKQVPMMHQKGNFGYREFDNCKVLELPYEGEQLSMFIILPNNPGELPMLENNLSIENLKSWLSPLPIKEVMVYLPKFKITWGTFELNEPLKDLGIKDAFTSRADFSGMNGRKNLFISKVLHKAFIDVNEEGTEAAAATAVIVNFKGGLPKLSIFNADHPFLFLIRDNTTGSILFLGRVVDPEEGK